MEAFDSLLVPKPHLPQRPCEDLALLGMGEVSLGKSGDVLHMCVIPSQILWRFWHHLGCRRLRGQLIWNVGANQSMPRGWLKSTFYNWHTVKRSRLGSFFTLMCLLHKTVTSSAKRSSTVGEKWDNKSKCLADVALPGQVNPKWNYKNKQ